MLLKYFSRELATSCWWKEAWWQSHSGVLRVLPHFKNQYESHYFQLEKYFYSVFVCFCNIWRLYEEIINIWYVIFDFLASQFLKTSHFALIIFLKWFFKQITYFGVRSTYPKVPLIRKSKIRTSEREIRCTVGYFVTYGWGNIEKTNHAR